MTMQELIKTIPHSNTILYLGMAICVAAPVLFIFYAIYNTDRKTTRKTLIIENIVVIAIITVIGVFIGITANKNKEINAQINAVLTENLQENYNITYAQPLSEETNGLYNWLQKLNDPGLDQPATLITLENNERAIFIARINENGEIVLTTPLKNFTTPQSMLEDITKKN